MEINTNTPFLITSINGTNHRSSHESLADIILSVRTNARRNTPAKFRNAHTCGSSWAIVEFRPVVPSKNTITLGKLRGDGTWSERNDSPEAAEAFAWIEANEGPQQEWVHPTLGVNAQGEKVA